ncbi:MAG: hypothetical protein IJL32_12435 [Oscillospiraceae bacterium]|nr:hypothetical protein [Oscillospiraceae bacterium]
MSNGFRFLFFSGSLFRFSEQFEWYTARAAAAARIPGTECTAAQTRCTHARTTTGISAAGFAAAETQEAEVCAEKTEDKGAKTGG